MTSLKPFIQWDLMGKAREGIFTRAECENHEKSWEDEYGSSHHCRHCNNPYGKIDYFRWVRRPEFDAPVVPDVNEQLRMNV